MGEQDERLKAKLQQVAVETAEQLVSRRLDSLVVEKVPVARLITFEFMRDICNPCGNDFCKIENSNNKYLGTRCQEDRCIKWLELGYAQNQITDNNNLRRGVSP